MLFAIDFDGTIVQQTHHYADLDTPLEFMPQAEQALRSLKAAEHVLLLWSSRASRALLYDPQLDPLVRAGIRKLNRSAWEKSYSLQWARYKQMLAFVEQRLQGVFDAIDDGAAGKPQVDFFIDDKAFRMDMLGTAWQALARRYGKG